MSRLLIAFGLLLVLALIACQGSAEAGLATDFSSLVDKLEAEGATVVHAGLEIEQPFFSISGQLVSVNGSDIQVFEFPNEASAQAAAALVSADGSTVGTSSILWVDTPHFYHSGKLIVIYVGSDQGALDLLVKVLGPQFAGG